MDIWVQTPATITNYAVRVGWFTGTNEYIVDPPTGGSWAEFDTANVNSSADWTLRTVSSSASHYAASSVALSATTWYHLRISSQVAGTISMQVGSANGALGSAVTSSTDVDATNGSGPMVQVIPRSNAAVTLTLDRFNYIAATGRL